jgi:hypothetical protein
MTRDELRTRIDALLGLESKMVVITEHDVELRYFTPTNILLFTLLIGTLDKSNWRVDGYQGYALPRAWWALKQLHEGK